ncbi:MAG: hypothetical protein II817_10285 [Bacteroidales bacterium]|nr:hypothetical protein [Bacteroidales bacterium]
MNLTTPILQSKSMFYTNDMKKSVDSFLALLLSSKKHSCIADEDFGFVFENLRYENIDPNRGIFINNEEKSVHRNAIYDKKINGTGKNTNNFAKDLKNTIEQYEKRLDNIDVSIDFQQNGKIVCITINGVLCDHRSTPYSYDYKINIW